jgi:hypothetical protein
MNTDTKIYQGFALPQFKVDFNLPFHKDHFKQEENGKELEILSIPKYVERMPNLSINDKSTIMAAIKIGAIPAIYVPGDKNGYNLVIWCEKAKSYQKVAWRGPGSEGKTKPVEVEKPIEKDEVVVPKLNPYKTLYSLQVKTVKSEKTEITAQEGDRWVEHREKYILLDSNDNKVYSVKKNKVTEMI